MIGGNQPIQRQLMVLMLVTTVVTALLVRILFFTYEFLAFREAQVRQLAAVGRVVAANSGDALRDNSPAAAQRVLVGLQVDSHIAKAILYDARGKIIATYPPDLSSAEAPALPEKLDFHLEGLSIVGFQEVRENERLLGRLHLRLEAGPIFRAWLWDSLTLTSLVLGLASVVAYFVARHLQRRISQPIEALAQVATAISQRRDYAVRATKFADDELGALTDAFNEMLARIQAQSLELQESSERIRAVINAALSAVVVIDAEGRILDWNARAEEMFGWTRREAMGRSLNELIVPATDREAHRRGMAQFSTSGSGPVLDRLIERQALRRDGREFPVEMSISPVQANGATSFCGFITDISARKAAEREIRQWNVNLEQRVRERTAQLEAVNRELEAFSYSVSHDLRAPLRHITGFADMLRQSAAERLDDTGRRHLGIISNAAKQMGALIDDLLVFSRLGRSELRRTRVNAGELVAEVIQEMADDMRGRRINWHIAALPEVYADRTLLKQVWVNLVSNAVKYSRLREVAVIRIGHRDNERSECEFSVADNGAGFDMQYVGKLFGVFQRLHMAEEFEGTGIGLANVQRIILRHGGRVWAEGKVDEGATFYFTLPKEEKRHEHTATHTIGGG